MHLYAFAPEGKSYRSIRLSLTFYVRRSGWSVEDSGCEKDYISANCVSSFNHHTTAMVARGNIFSCYSQSYNNIAPVEGQSLLQFDQTFNDVRLSKADLFTAVPNSCISTISSREIYLDIESRCVCKTPAFKLLLIELTWHRKAKHKQHHQSDWTTDITSRLRFFT